MTFSLVPSFCDAFERVLRGENASDGDDDGFRIILFSSFRGRLFSFVPFVVGVEGAARFGESTPCLAEIDDRLDFSFSLDVALASLDLVAFGDSFTSFVDGPAFECLSEVLLV